ncbi:sugar ABC transporter permease [Heyndrickxia shackletonii]|uniref:Sugar ABC transporter permease n=1 Tax=Heyndrickxia shackletonii TaxID=157838 RepID=A0A0Q3X127_9BACI|nr:carbohydrate ABC transporter permease [Heyndrickxia shackletonii]KQL55373.1 sugar ABC transporter permease [Heyndrickxia shackletonii]MBB2481024.1 carbohydrate ABC transporter permease [Bacillus sp. APMAM]NEY98875.1 carbohydrate ABC transporter permease [Heyndrickxia shackletonii]RTZ55647.1 carbohydrate ABC transporter permease [Bacillus sp. SAJ1]
MKGKHLWIHLVLIIGAVIMVIPFIWMILTSLKTYAESVQVPPKIFPKVFQWHNYKEVFDLLPFFKFMLNTFIVTVIRTIGQLFLCSIAAYAFARISFPGRNVLFILVLSVLMVPSQVFLLPQYMIMVKLNWLNTLQAVIVPGLFSAFGTFLLRQFFMGLPKELEEAARLDGCNHFQIYWKIMLPLAKPGLIALGIFTALWSWNELMWPLIVNSSSEKMTLSVGLSSLQGQYVTNYPILMAGSFLAILPMLILFMFLQKRFIEGIAITGGK